MSASVGKTSRDLDLAFCVWSLLLLMVAVDIASTTDTSLVPASDLSKNGIKVTAPSYRLPTALSPLHYDLELRPYIYGLDPDSFSVKGSVKILIRCNNATNKIVLNWDGTNLDQSSINFYRENTPVPDESNYDVFDEDKESQLITITLDDNMVPGDNYYIEMKFETAITNEGTGLFYSNYTRAGQTIYLASTEFQPAYARTVFPCFDEPAMKATFKLTVVRRKDRISLSNMPLESNHPFPDNGITYEKDVYKETPVMSTHSLAFVICDFISLENKTRHNNVLRTWSKKETLEDTSFALDLGLNLNHYFEYHFGTKYPLVKQDHLALPGYGAVSNLGLNIYKDTLLRYTDNNYTQEDKQTVVRAVSFGLAHEWFSDIVTPAWWSDIWLTEGLAGFYEHLGVHFVYPDWKTNDNFIKDNLHISFAYDGAHNSHPLFQEVEAPTDIPAMFDIFAYRKNFMKNHIFGIVTHDDLFKEMTQEARRHGLDLDVKEIMDTWILQSNYPLVTVTRDFNNHSVIHVRQERFLSDPKAKDPGTNVSPFNYRWTIPLTFTSSKFFQFERNASQIRYIHKDQHSLEVHLPSGLPECSDSDSWILANIYQMGYYRVNYHSGNWLALSKQLQVKHSNIPNINRAQIINDAWNLAKASYIPLTIALSTIEYLDKEREYLPWYSAWAELQFVDTMLSFTSLYGAFQAFMKDKLEEPFKYFGFQKPSQDHMSLFTRLLVANQACYYGNGACTDEAIKLYSEWMENKDQTVHPNIKKVVFCHAIANGALKHWDHALNMFKELESDSEREMLANAMACSKKPWILNKLLHFLVEDGLRVTDRIAESVLYLVALNKNGRYLAWDFYRSNYNVLKTKYESLECQYALPELVDYFNTELELKEAKAFGERWCPEIPGQAFQAMVVDKIQTNILWMKTNPPIIRNWLKEKGYLND